ncbi:MAG TPA: YlxR family protein [bacterium]|nr:YlxR family protein [bacterium]HPN42433.1 YlxR family protein [bacterium]
MNEPAEKIKPAYPVRTCIGCYAKKSKYELVRIVLHADGRVLPDSDGKTGGRGAYVCPNEDCLEQAIKKKRFDRAFRCSIDKKSMVNLKNGFTECLKTRSEHY